MIVHVTLYRFPATVTNEQRSAFAQALSAASRATGLVARYEAGEHLPLPADAGASHAVWAFAASWTFAVAADLAAFSEHSEMRKFIAAWIEPLGIEIGFVNYAPARDSARVAIVTGAASGIGAATARCLAAEGTIVAAVDRDPAVLGSEREMVVPFCVDVVDRPAIEKLIAGVVQRHGPVDAIVNCAAIMREHAAPGELRRADWDELLETNLFGTVNVCQAALPHMREGAIVNTASIVGTVRSMPARCAYSAAKAALVSFTRDLAVAYGPQGLRANVLVPGFIDTPMSRAMTAGRAEQARAEELRIPLRRIGRAEEVARAARFLVSTEASYINGSLMFVDGGLGLV